MWRLIWTRRFTEDDFSLRGFPSEVPSSSPSRPWQFRLSLSIRLSPRKGLFNQAISIVSLYVSSLGWARFNLWNYWCRLVKKLRVRCLSSERLSVGKRSTRIVFSNSYLSGVRKKIKIKKTS
jgi:hypothetical protein